MISRVSPLDRDGAANDALVAAEFALPVGVRENDGLRGAGRIILACKEAAEDGSDAEYRESAVGDVESGDMLGLADSGDRTGIAVIHSDVLEAGALLSLDEVDERRHVEVAVKADAASGVPEADELLRMRVAERLEQNAIDDPEDYGVGADAYSKRDQRDRGEERTAEKASENMFQVVEGKSHGGVLNWSPGGRV